MQLDHLITQRAAQTVDCLAEKGRLERTNDVQARLRGRTSTGGDAGYYERVVARKAIKVSIGSLCRDLAVWPSTTIGHRTHEIA